MAFPSSCKTAWANKPGYLKMTARAHLGLLKQGASWTKGSLFRQWCEGGWAVCKGLAFKPRLPEAKPVGLPLTGKAVVILALCRGTHPGQLGTCQLGKPIFSQASGIGCLEFCIEKLRGPVRDPRKRVS